MKTLCIIPFSNIGRQILDYLYKTLNVPDTVAYYKHRNISELYNDIVTYIITILPETDQIEDLISTDKIFTEFNLGLKTKYDEYCLDMLYRNKEELKILMLYVIHELKLYLSTGNDEVYIISSLDDRTLMCYKHHIDKESDDLVFNGE